ncbi:MAG: N-methyl-L-tryptophan oxidase [Acidobacteriota bacterium]
MTARRRHGVLVLGGGVVGAAAARALARGDESRRPVDVVLVDAHPPGHRHGSSHGDGRIVRLTYPEAIYLDMARRSFAGWRALEAERDESLLVTTGTYECGPARSPVIAELAASLAVSGVPYRRLDTEASRRRFPQIELPLGAEAIYQPDGAVIHAERAVAALWRSADAAGARTHSDLRIEALEIEDDGVIARGTRRDGAAEVIHAERLVLATGAWTSGFAETLGLDLPLCVTREVVAYFPISPRTTNYGDDHHVGGMPAVIDYHEPHPFYVLPQIEVAGLKVGWHRTGPATDPDTDAVPDPDILRRITGFVADRLPYLDLHPVVTTTCLYTCTPDYHFVVDRHPRWPHVVLGTGFSGHGFKFAPVLGEMLADLVLDTIPRASDMNTTAPHDLFHLARFAHAELVPRRSA